MNSKDKGKQLGSGKPTETGSDSLMNNGNNPMNNGKWQVFHNSKTGMYYLATVKNGCFHTHGCELKYEEDALDFASYLNGEWSVKRSWFGMYILTKRLTDEVYRKRFRRYADAIAMANELNKGGTNNGS